MLNHMLKIIDDLKEGKSQQLIGDIHGVLKSTVGDIWKDRGKSANHETNHYLYDDLCIIQFESID